MKRFKPDDFKWTKPQLSLYNRKFYIGMRLRSSIITIRKRESENRLRTLSPSMPETRGEEHLNRDNHNDNQSVSGIRTTRGKTTFSGRTGRSTLGKFRGRVPQPGGIGTGKSRKKSICNWKVDENFAGQCCVFVIIGDGFWYVVLGWVEEPDRRRDVMKVQGFLKVKLLRWSNWRRSVRIMSAG